MDDLVTPALIYLSIGGVLWLVLDGLGIIDNTFAARTQASPRAMVLATLMMIFGWPVFCLQLAQGNVEHVMPLAIDLDVINPFGDLRLPLMVIAVMLSMLLGGAVVEYLRAFVIHKRVGR